MTSYSIPRLRTVALHTDATSQTHSVQMVAAGIVSIGFCISWILPYRTYPYASFYNDYLCLLAVAVSLLVLYFREKQQTAVVPAAFGLPAGIALVIAVDAFSGRMWAPREALVPIGYLLLAGGAIMLGRNLATAGSKGMQDRDRVFDFFCAALLLAGLISAVITFCQYLGIDDRLGDWSVPIGNDGVSAIRPYANLGQPNQLALILCWALAALWRMFVRDITSGFVSFLLAVVILASLALTQSKVVWLIGPMLAGLVVFANRRLTTRGVSFVALVAMALLLGGFIVLLPHLSEFLGTMTEDVTQRMETNGVRSIMILQGLYISIRHPLAGVGWSGFGASQIEVASLFGETQYAMHAHDFVANLAAETGWPITVGVVVAIAFWLYRRYIKRAITTNTLFALMVFGAVAIHSMVEFPLWYGYILMPIGLLIGLTDSELDMQGRLAITRLPIVVSSLIAALLMVGVASDYRNVVQAFRTLGLQRIGLASREGQNIEPELTIFPHFYRYIAFADLQPTVHMASEAIVNAERVARRFGYAPVLMRLATIYALNDRPDDAVRLVTAIQHLYPQRYRETYEAWRVLGDQYPGLAGSVFHRLPRPGARLG